MTSAAEFQIKQILSFFCTEPITFEKWSEGAKRLCKGRHGIMFFSEVEEKRVNLFLLPHVLYGLLPVSVMRVLFWRCWPGIPLTVGCSSLSPSVLNLDVTQGEGGAVSHKGLVSGRPIGNKCVCLSEGDNCREARNVLFPQNISARSAALSCAETAGGNNPGIHLA